MYSKYCKYPLFAILVIQTACGEILPSPAADDGITDAGEGYEMGDPGTESGDVGLDGGAGDGDGDGDANIGFGAGDDDGAGDGDGDGDGDGEPSGPVCGNEVVEAGEECDLGSDNSDTGECTSLCMNQVCGDGFIGPNEQCDNGVYNGVGKCSSTCELFEA